MNRRHVLISALASACAGRATARDQPWSARLLQGGFDGLYWWSGLGIELKPNWKTYWRMPGDSGIAPDIQADGANLESQQVLFPLPQRFEGLAGTTIGYVDQVVFPIALKPKQPGLSMFVNIKSFLGVCEDMCIPARFEAAISFDPGKASAPDETLIATWRRTVPTVSKTKIISSARLELTHGKPTLVLALTINARDIFVEGPSAYAFGRPVFTDGKARLAVHGKGASDALEGQALRVTVSTTEGGLEQEVVVG